MSALFDLFYEESRIVMEGVCKPHPKFGRDVMVAETERSEDPDESTPEEPKYLPYGFVDNPATAGIEEYKFIPKKSLKTRMAAAAKLAVYKVFVEREKLLPKFVAALHCGAAANAIASGKLGKGKKGQSIGKFKVAPKANTALDFTGLMSAEAGAKLANEIKEQLSEDVVEDFQQQILACVNDSEEPSHPVFRFVCDGLEGTVADGENSLEDAAAEIDAALSAFVYDDKQRLEWIMATVQQYAAIQEKYPAEHEDKREAAYLSVRAQLKAFIDDLPDHENYVIFRAKPEEDAPEDIPEEVFALVPPKDRKAYQKILGKCKGSFIVADATPCAQPPKHYTFYFPTVLMYSRKQ